MGSIKLSNLPALSGQISFNVPLPIVSFTNTFSESQINSVGNSFQFKISEIDSANNQTIIGTRTVGNSARPFITRYNALPNNQPFGLFSVSSPSAFLTSEPLLLTPNNLTSSSSAIPVSFVPAMGIQVS